MLGEEGCFHEREKREREREAAATLSRGVEQDLSETVCFLQGRETRRRRTSYWIPITGFSSSDRKMAVEEGTSQDSEEEEGGDCMLRSKEK